MVNNKNAVYLFIGQDNISKNTRLAKIKQDFLPAGLENFNSDTLYARELNLKTLQERLLVLPIKAKKRIVIIKEADSLRPEIKKFILSYCHKPASTIILILDIERSDPRDDFISGLTRYASIFRFREDPRLDTFVLARQINLRRPDNALKVLNQLLKEGEKPERILGGLRYTFEKDALNPLEIRRRLKALIGCDIEIKTGKLRPDFALEKLVVILCSLSKAAR